MCETHGYASLLAGMQRFANGAEGTWFVTDVDKDELWNVYLGNIPMEHRQYYTCNTCKAFVKKYGNIVTLDQRGKSTSVMFSGDVSGFFAPAWSAMKRMVERAKVVNVFKSASSVLGTPKAGLWDHFSVSVRAPHTHPSAHEYMNTKRENFALVQQALQKYTVDVVDAALQVLESGALYRADRVSGTAKFLKKLHDARANALHKSNAVWYHVSTAPDAFCHISSSVVGSLLDDIVAGMSFEAVKARFDAKMNPATYQRATVAPSAGAVQQAEKLFAEMDLAPSLARRFAQLEDLPSTAYVWSSPIEKKVAQTGIFSSVQTKKQASTQRTPLTIEPRKITWEKFQRDVLPTVTKFEVKSNSQRKVALTTAQDSDARPILAWDTEEQRNPFAWYYSGGIDAEMKRRLDREGGKYQDVLMRASLMWNTRTDLDIHVTTPQGQISFRNKSIATGYLDVDMNVHGETLEPVENVRWVGSVPNGTYGVYVNNYTDRALGSNPFTVEIDAGGIIHMFEATANCSNSASNTYGMIHVADVVHRNGEFTVIPFVTRRTQVNSVQATEYKSVHSVITSPNMWYTSHEHFGSHVFFLTNDTDVPSNARGFSTEMLRSDIKPVRSVIENYMNSNPVTGSAGVVGYGISKDSTGDTMVRVTQQGGLVQEYIIDRWE